MAKDYQVLVPEIVPLDNKGEEAIVRGIADVLFPDGNCEIHLFDEVDEYRFQDGLHIYPAKWFISPWLNREFGLGASWEKLRDSACSLVRNGLHKLYPRWVERRSAALSATYSEMKRLSDGTPPVDDKQRHLMRLLDCDYVVAGHDGALDESVCHVIDVMREFGKELGVFGVEFRTSFRSKAIVELYRKSLRSNQFFYSRTASSVETVRRYLPDIDAELLPDPAFGMRPASDETVDKLIAMEGLESFFSKPVVMCTCCEPSPIARYCFEEFKRPDLKLAAHRRLFAELLQHIARVYDVNILFLPHAIGPDSALDDRIVARDILSRSQLPSDRACLFSAECSARELKGLIKRGELLVAERIHSMIGATGVHTPFFCLGSHTDRRIRGIIEEMVGMEDAVYFLNRPTISELTAKFDDIWMRRDSLKSRLVDVSGMLHSRLEEGAVVMRERIELGES